MSTTTIETKYFKIAGGSTVLQLDGSLWTRWDYHEGLVSTDLDWVESDSNLERITKDEAIALMK